jgi:hypothetical protein
MVPSGSRAGWRGVQPRETRHIKAACSPNRGRTRTEQPGVQRTHISPTNTLETRHKSRRTSRLHSNLKFGSPKAEASTDGGLLNCRAAGEPPLDRAQFKYIRNLQERLGRGQFCVYVRNSAEKFQRTNQSST